MKDKDNIFMDEVEPAKPQDDINADKAMIDLSEVEECDEEAQG